jgi:hypothetical protein
MIHKHLYRLVLLMSDLSGGMIRMADVISVNQAIKVDNYDVGNQVFLTFNSALLSQLIRLRVWVHRAETRPPPLQSEKLERAS